MPTGHDKPALFGSRATRLSGAIVVALVAAALAPAAGHANHSVFERASAGAINGNGSLNADFTGASADGARVFFETSERLVGADTDSTDDVYERSGGTTKRVSAGAIKGNGAFPASFRGASSDGTRVFFTTDEKLVSGDTDARLDVYERSGGATRLVSAGATNGNGAFDALLAGASADGTRVFFLTDERLASGDTDARFDVYERSGGTTRLVSAGAINGNGAFDALLAGASADGTRVFFQTQEQLVTGDTDARFDVYERSGGTTKLVSAGTSILDASFRGASADGTRVFFETSESLTSDDIDFSRDLYERSAGTTRLASAGAINGNGDHNVDFAGAAADGTRVFFYTTEQLVSADTDDSLDVYERSRGATKLMSAGATGGNGAFPVSFQGASAGGTRVFFGSAERLVSGDTDDSFDVYERAGGATRRLSVGATGGNGAFDASFQGASADGRRVFFQTTESLVNGDTDDGARDVYERFGGATTLVSRGVITGNAGFDAFFDGASQDGTDVFFGTREKLVGGDEDAAVDIYATRVP